MPLTPQTDIESLFNNITSGIEALLAQSGYERQSAGDRHGSYIWLWANNTRNPKTGITLAATETTMQGVYSVEVYGGADNDRGFMKMLRGSIQVSEKGLVQQDPSDLIRILDIAENARQYAESLRSEDLTEVHTTPYPIMRQ